MKRVTIIYGFLVKVYLCAKIPDEHQVWTDIFGGVDDRNAAPSSNIRKADSPHGDPCGPIVGPPMPDFRASYRRTSQTKCYEYIWQRKQVLDTINRKSKCTVHISVVGGHTTNPRDFPHMGAIGWRSADPKEQWVFKCGCSLISPNFVLTAGLCTQVSSRDTTVLDFVPKIIRLGSRDITNAPEGQRTTYVDASISGITSHPSYDPPRKYYDIALIQLKDNVELTDTIIPACLWTSLDTNSMPDKATVTGWGATDAHKRVPSSILQAAVLDIIDFNTCNQLLRSSCNRNWCGLQEHQICAGNLTGGVDSCQGDSGGPLQTSLRLPSTYGELYHVIGVTSFGIGCARAETPGVYVNVAYFIDWIESIVWGGRS